MSKRMPLELRSIKNTAGKRDPDVDGAADDRENLNGSAGTVTLKSDLMQPDFLAAAQAHRMNNCCVFTLVSRLLTGTFSYIVLTACLVHSWRLAAQNQVLASLILSCVLHLLLMIEVLNRDA